MSRAVAGTPCQPDRRSGATLCCTGRRLLRLLAASWLALALPAAAATCTKLQRVADGVYLHAATSPLASRANGGRTGNSVVLVGRSGVTVIDPGPTLNAGRALTCGIRRLTRRPVVALIDTHPHPEQVLANGAFPGVPIYASRTTAETMQRRCTSCRARLEATIGQREMAGTEAVIPDRLIATATRIEPGGRPLLLLPLGDAHSHGDLAVIDETTGTLISGDLGNNATLPDLRDGNTAGWIAALRGLTERTDVQRVIPGFGPPTEPAALQRPLDYLQALQQFSEREVAAGEMMPPAGVPDVLRPFGGSEEMQLLNLQHVFREAEEGWWAKPSGPVPTADATH